MNLVLPELCLVVLVGVSGSGKSTLARRLFLPTEVVSSDACRGLVADDENDQAATKQAFEVLHTIVAKRLELGRLTVVDATNVQPDARKALVELAKRYHVLLVAVVVDVPRNVCAERNAVRPDRNFGDHVLRNQHAAFRRSLGGFNREGFRKVFHLRGVAEVEAATIEREPSWNDRRSLHGPFDIVGDVHGCHDELVALLGSLGWTVDGDTASHPEGRTAVFVGDLVDRGPASPAVLRLVMAMVRSGAALCVPGNHDTKLARALKGAQVTPSHGLDRTLAQLADEPEAFRDEVRRFLDGLVSHLVLDDGKLVVAHAGLREEMHNRQSGVVRSFALYGDTTGETDEYGFPVRYPWAEEYRGRAAVVYGHTPVLAPEWVNNTLCLDTGCVFGGSLTALRWPEREIVSVPALTEHYPPARPTRPVPTGVGLAVGELDLADLLGTLRIETRLGNSVTVRETQTAAALEIISRFAADPRWLVYLPPTMAPVATSTRPDVLEHPDEAFAQFREDGVDVVVCEEKHMGSRAVVIVTRDDSVARRRFGVDGSGRILTRTGREFFNDAAVEAALLDRLRVGLEGAGLWDELGTDWLVIDSELLPWSAKAAELLRTQYAAVGASARASLEAASSLLSQAAGRGLDVGELVESVSVRRGMAESFVDAYRRYCWTVDSVDDLRLAPFQILAGEGAVHALSPHTWHLSLIDRLCEAAPGTLRRTDRRVVPLADGAAVAEATAWWETMTAAGGEGMVVKPDAVVVSTKRGLAQPGVKVRGREYLRIIYGPDYTAAANLERLRRRGLAHKRSLAAREFALGIESLERFAAGEPLHRVHPPVFAVLALESDPVDPRL